MADTIEIRAPGLEPRRLSVVGTIDVGRDCDGIVLADPEVSRRHLTLRRGNDGLWLTDLNSTNGTFVNGVRVRAPTLLRPGDVVRLGAVELIAVPADGTSDLPRPRPLLEELASRSLDAAVLRYVPGTAGASAAPAYASSVRRARRRLAGLGSEPWGVKPQICLVDPFPDPADPADVMARGTIVDSAHGEIWLVVTPDSPPEPPERPLALFFGAALPAGKELESLVEGYGLHLTRVPSPDAYLAERPLPPLVHADGELRSLMALSLVRYLLDRGGEADFLRFLATAQPGAVDSAAQQIYGAGLAALEEDWERSLDTAGPPAGLGQFLRLAAGYLRPYAWREAEMFVYMLLQLGFAVAFPFALKYLIDVAVRSRDLPAAMTTIAGLAVVLAVSLLAELRLAYVAASVSASVVRKLRTEMFDTLQTLSAGWYAARKQGDVLSRLLSDVKALESGISRTLREGVFQAVSLVVTTIVLFLISPVIALVVLVGAPLVATVYRRMEAGALRRSRAVQEQTGALVSIAAENYSAHAVVQAFGLESGERRKFRRAADRLFTRQLRLQLFGGVFNLSVDVIFAVVRLAVMGVGAWLILRGQLTVGAFAAVMTQIGGVLGPVSALTNLGEQIQSSTGALQRVEEVLLAQPEIADSPRAAPLPRLRREIQLSRVSFGYRHDRPVLVEVDAVIAAGEKVAFVGPTGAGKSSLLQLLMRFYDPGAGAVLFDGSDVRAASLASLRSQVGMVFQETFLFDGSVRENIGLGSPGATAEQIVAAAQAAQLHEFVSTLPHGYDTPVGERGVRLSGGQRQRLAIARALVRDPAVLLLDEATSALDPRTERMITDTLEAAGEGRTTIAVTHRLTSVVSYDRIFVLDEGRIVEQGKHEELLAHGGVYAELWAEQSGGAAAVEPGADAVRAGLPMFAEVDVDNLRSLANGAVRLCLEPAETLAEGGGRLYVVTEGRGEILKPGPDGGLVFAAPLAPGQAFGISALAGVEDRSVLRAVESMTLLVISAEIGGLPPAWMRRDADLPAIRPAGGERLSQVRIPPPLAYGMSPSDGLGRASGLD